MVYLTWSVRANIGQPDKQKYRSITRIMITCLAKLKCTVAKVLIRELTLLLTHSTLGYSQNISDKAVNYRCTCTSLWQLWLPYILVTVRRVPVGHNIMGRSLLDPWQATGKRTNTRVSHLWRPSSISDHYVRFVVRKVALIQVFLPALHFFPCQYNSTIAAHSLSYHRRRINLAIDSVLMYHS
jgi:hypothetical protein